MTSSRTWAKLRLRGELGSLDTAMLVRRMQRVQAAHRSTCSHARTQQGTVPRAMLYNSLGARMLCQCHVQCPHCACTPSANTCHPLPHPQHSPPPSHADTNQAPPQPEAAVLHADARLHAKKKWKISKRANFVARQDVPNGNWASVPSPELQLEHEVCSVLSDQHTAQHQDGEPRGLAQLIEALLHLACKLIGAAMRTPHARYPAHRSASKAPDCCHVIKAPTTLGTKFLCAARPAQVATCCSDHTPLPVRRRRRAVVPGRCPVCIPYSLPIF